ncbi:MAG TPA: type IV pilus assembly protein PilM [Candidatus Paceibacterota bacterium]
MLEFLTLRPKAFGVDISDLSVKMAQLKPARDGFKLGAFAQTALAKGVVREGQIQKQDELVAALKKGVQALRRKGVKTNYIVASLPEQQAFLQIAQLPKMKKEEVTRAIRFEAENYIPYPLDTMYLDYAIIPPFHNHVDHVDVLLASLPKEAVDPYVAAFEQAGLIPVALEIESLALSRALMEKQVSPVPVLLIDLGAVGTNVCIFSGYSLRLTTSLSVSANKLSNAIQGALGVSEEKAEELKLAHGVLDEGHPVGKQVRDALSEPLGELAQEIEKYLEYHESHMPHQHLGVPQKKIKKIMLCGGGANLRGLPDFLTKELKTEVVVGNPWVNILSSRSREIPELSFADSLRYTTALGLALRGAQHYD